MDNIDDKDGIVEKFNYVKTTGEKTHFETGAVRDKKDGKGKYVLMPPLALHRLARHFENGAAVYGERNWESGIPLANYMDSALRHMNFYLAGMRDEDHLAAAAWNILCLIETQERINKGFLPENLDNLPHIVDGKLIVNNRS